jgi:hypothetical protein
MPQWTPELADIVYAVAEPIEPAQRGQFFAAVASELAVYQVLGEGLIYRAAAEAQSRFDVKARTEATNGKSVVRRWSRKRAEVDPIGDE